jgi:SAM-dependent methyltransferase
MKMAILAKSESGDARLVSLKEKLARFYLGNAEYYEHAEGTKDFIYEPMLDRLLKMSNAKRPLRVLELGAGRTSFPAFVRDAGCAVNIEFTAYDVNRSNVEFYHQHNIQFIIGDLIEVASWGPYDFIFSTFVYEHLVEPQDFLAQMCRNLAPDGKFLIVCPKYVFPGYVPPALRWLPLWRQHRLTCFLALSNFRARITGHPNFWICVDPAVLRLPFRRDYDAVHMVSATDLRAALKPDFMVRRFPLKRQGLKARLLDRLMLLSVIAEPRQ